MNKQKQEALFRKKEKEARLIIKEQDLEFIRKFANISVANICKEHDIDKGNLWKGTTTAENVALVKQELIKKIKELDLD